MSQVALIECSFILKIDLSLTSNSPDFVIFCAVALLHLLSQLVFQVSENFIK